VEKSGGLFIFATTLMKLMDAPLDNSALPQERLRQALTAKVGLDALYRDVLSGAGPIPYFNRVIGTIMLLRSPLPIASLGYLLQLSAEQVVASVWGIQSILMIPGNDDEAIEPFHASLRDFLVARERSASLYINPPTRHLWIVTNCLEAMKVKPRDGFFYEGGQEYPCRNWCRHVVLGLNESEGDGLLTSPPGAYLTSYLADFASQSLYFWVNTLLREGYESEMISVLDSGLSLLKVCAVPDPFEAGQETNQPLFSKYQIAHNSCSKSVRILGNR
jgi:hypothetical protein